MEVVCAMLASRWGPSKALQFFKNEKFWQLTSLFVGWCAHPYVARWIYNQIEIS